MIYKVIFILIGVFVIIPYVTPLIETKLNFGNIFGIGIGLVFITIGFLFNIVKNLLIFKILISLFILCLGLFFIILFFIISKSKKTAKAEETIIILGCRVKGDKPSLSLIERCKVASEHLKKNENAVAILSGGQGADELISEAECMKRLMLDFGIEEGRLHLENKSTSTDENIEFSKRIIEENNLSNSIAIATSEYHEARAIMIAKRYGFNAKSLPCKTLSRVKIPFYTREVFGIIKELLSWVALLLLIKLYRYTKISWQL